MYGCYARQNVARWKWEWLTLLRALLRQAFLGRCTHAPRVLLFCAPHVLPCAATTRDWRLAALTALPAAAQSDVTLPLFPLRYTPTARIYMATTFTQTHRQNRFLQSVRQPVPLAYRQKHKPWWDIYPAPATATAHPPPNTACLPMRYAHTPSPYRRNKRRLGLHHDICSSSSFTHCGTPADLPPYPSITLAPTLTTPYLTLLHFHSVNMTLPRWA